VAVAQLRVVTHRVPDEVGELPEGFDTRVTGADEDERQLAAAAGLRRRGGGGLEPPEHVVAQVDPLGEILEAEPVLREPGDRKHARDGAERDDELPVADGLDAFVHLYTRDLVLEVDSRCSSDQELGVGHICRSGTTACLGSSVPDAASGRRAVKSMKLTGLTMVAPSRPK
jgi:hypothetical protein